MSTYTSIVRQLDASRRLEEELAIEKHRQELEKQKIDHQLEGLRRSRREFIDNELSNSKKDFQDRLRENPDLAEEHHERQKRADREKSKIAQQDFEIERTRLLEERNKYDAIDKEYRIVDKALLDLQARSRYSGEQEDRKIHELELRRKLVVKLLDDSKRRELDRFNRAKQLAI